MFFVWLLYLVRVFDVRAGGIYRRVQGFGGELEVQCQTILVFFRVVCRGRQRGCVCVQFFFVRRFSGVFILRVLFLVFSCCSSWEIWLVEFSRSLERLVWSRCTFFISWVIFRFLAVNLIFRLERVSIFMVCFCGGERNDKLYQFRVGFRVICVGDGGKSTQKEGCGR